LADFIISKIKPVQIALWNGIVMGGGVGVSIHAPIRIATDSTVFAMPETKIGLIPDIGGSYFLPRIFNKNPNVGLYMGLTGERIKGKDLALCGLATHYATPEKFEIIKKKLIEDVDEHFNYSKLFLYISGLSDLTYKDEDFKINHLNEINKIFKLDSIPEIYKRLKDVADNHEKEDVKKWASNIHKNMLTYSPISMVLTLEQQKRGANIKTLEEAFQMELKIITK
jgi:3-hydroxyisobutyryl-CoA hydrolase